MYQAQTQTESVKLNESNFKATKLKQNQTKSRNINEQLKHNQAASINIDKIN